MMLDRARIEAAADKGQFSGIVTVDVGDDRVFELCRGFAHRALAVPNQPETQFAMASGNKAFTALAIMRLVEDGLLAPEQPVRELLGDDLPLIDERVTIAHLLGHTSGIGDYLDESAEWAATDYVLTVPVHTLTTAESMLPLLDGHPQVFEPGSRFAYNNGGFVVLGIILERLTGEPFQEATRRLVLEPAGLADTGFPRLDELPGRAALGYLFAEGNRTNVLHLPVQGSADGGAFTTATDLHAFWRALFTGRIVELETVRRMTTPLNEDPDEKLHYGWGFYVHSADRAAILMGYDAGTDFGTWHLAAEDTTISVLGNWTDGAGWITSAISEALAEHLAG